MNTKQASRPLAAVALAAPAELDCTTQPTASATDVYARQYEYVGDGQWQPTDPEARGTGVPVQVPEVVIDKCREHGPGEVSRVLGMSRATVLSYGIGGPSLAMTCFVIAQRLYLLHQLDIAADARSAKAG